VTYTIVATVAAAASGEMTSTAAVVAPAGDVDPNSIDDDAFDVDSVVDDRIFADGFDTAVL
jgi:hypothetical protein